MVIFQAHRIYTYGVAAAYLQSTFSPVSTQLKSFIEIDEI